MDGFRRIAMAGVFLCLGGCTTYLEPTPAGSVPVLEEGQGLLVIVFDLADPITDIRLNPDGFNAGSLMIERMPRGVSAFVHPVKAGRYCLDRFTVYNRRLHFTNSDGICVQVEPGVISYGGHFAPRAAGYGLVARSFHFYDYRAFNALMERDFQALLDEFEVDRSDFHPDEAEDF